MIGAYGAGELLRMAALAAGNQGWQFALAACRGVFRRCGGLPGG